MMHHLGTLIVSFLITNWIYSEILLLCPQVEPYAARLAQVLRIPTHDEWADIIDSEEAVALSKELDSFILSSGLREVFQDLRASQSRVRGKKSSRGVAPGEVPAGAGEASNSLDALEFSTFLNKPSLRLPYQSGSNVFNASKRRYVNGGFKHFEFDRLENLANKSPDEESY